MNELIDTRTPNPGMRRLSSSKGYTLIELIVTIAIIALLACLVPSEYSAAISAANETACMSNVRAYGNGALLGIADHNGMCVPPRDAGDDDIDQEWMAPYLPSMPLICPSFRRNNGDVVPYGGNTYALNDSLVRDFPAVLTIPAPHSRVVLVSEKYCGDFFSSWLHMDMTMWGIGANYYAASSYPSHDGEDRASQYHSNTAHRGLNIFMLDGSAALVRPETGTWAPPSSIYGTPSNSGYFYDAAQFAGREW